MEINQAYPRELYNKSFKIREFKKGKESGVSLETHLIA
jgi:hypothetical protein